MTSPIVQDSGPFREWAPLTTLLQKIPAKIQSGLFTQNVNFTCIDVVADFIAVGTNHGVVYWFHRKTGQLENLACENVNSCITCVQIVSTVDYMVAAGNDQGVVTVFQIPKKIPDSLPETFKSRKKKQVERFNISGLHKVPVTVVEWSKNGMKVFSGDQSGLIVLTEMDFYLHLSKSTELLNEKYSVVQLSYHSGLLLISTLFRTIIVDINKNNQVTQVGQKERKMLCKLGAVFSKNKDHIQGPVIYASRPGLRIWQADKNGTVLKTLILKEAVKTDRTQVELLNPVSVNSKRKSQGDPTFGVIKYLSDGLLVTFNEEVIYIINPDTITITSVIKDLRKVNDIACSEDELFILEGERNILRIASYPETYYDTDQDEFINPITVNAESNRPLSWGFTDLSSKLKSNPIVPVIPFLKMKPPNFIQSTSILAPVVVGLDTSSVTNAEEAIEIPPIVPLNLDTHLVTDVDTAKEEIETRKNIFQKISEQDFEEVVFTPRKRDKKKLLNTLETAQSSSAEKINHCNGNDFILKSKKNLDSIQKDIQDKEKLLSNYLDLDLSKYMDERQTRRPKKSISTSIDPSELTYLLTINNRESTETLGLVNSKIEKNNYETKESMVEHSTDKSENVLETKPQDDFRHEKSDTDRTISESHFNALSKEFVKSTVYQDNDDWILLG